MQADLLNFMPGTTTAADRRPSTLLRPEEVRSSFTQRPCLPATKDRRQPLSPLASHWGGQRSPSVVKLRGLTALRGGLRGRRSAPEGSGRAGDQIARNRVQCGLLGVWRRIEESGD
jgi:hypothetical protein